MTATTVHLARVGDLPAAGAPAAESGQRDDRAAAALLDELVRRHGGMLHAVAQRVVGSPSAAEDVVQEAYAKAWRARHSVRADGMHVGWLYTIVRRAAYDAVRARQRAGQVELTELNAQAAPDHGDDVAVDADVSAALARLAPSFRSTVELVDVHGLTYDEAARLLGVSRNTIASRLHRAHRALRLSLAHLRHEPGTPMPVAATGCRDCA